MSNHTIAAPITTWAEVRTTDRGALDRAEVAALLTVDARTVDHAIEDGTIPAIRLGRCVLIPRRPFLAAFYPAVSRGGWTVCQLKSHRAIFESRSTSRRHGHQVSRISPCAECRNSVVDVSPHPGA